jgi:hypothetical protein
MTGLATFTREEQRRAGSASAEAARRLDAFNRIRFTPGESATSDAEEWALRKLELELVESELARARERAAAAPCDPDAFVGWFEALEDDGPGQHDRLFDWLASDASRDEMTWFLRQEVAGEAGFDDLVALTQVKMPERAKLELARNYWDEMGQGQASAMHGPMLAHLADELGTRDSPAEVVWEAFALANLMVGLAVHRRHAFRSVGALGAIELTAPWRASKVNEGLKRLGLGGEARRYYALHATLDVRHSSAWNREVIHPLVAADPRHARQIAEGALARLDAGRRCFERYRQELGV